MSEMRESIKEDKFPDYVKKFFEKMFPEKDYPAWAVDALKSVQIDFVSNK